MTPRHQTGLELLSLHRKSISLDRCGLLLVILVKQHSVVDILPVRSTPGTSPTTVPSTRLRVTTNLSVLTVGRLKEYASASIQVSATDAALSLNGILTLHDMAQDLILQPNPRLYIWLQFMTRVMDLF